MVVTHIWRNCLLTELNISDSWFNVDALLAKQKRQDVFLVRVYHHEVHSQILLHIKDAGHKTKIYEWISQPNIGDSFKVLVSRNADFIQFYPFLSPEHNGSLWEKGTTEVYVIGVHDLKTVCTTMESISEHD
jgi:hypothetical protein